MDMGFSQIRCWPRGPDAHFLRGLPLLAFPALPLPFLVLLSPPLWLPDAWLLDAWLPEAWPLVVVTMQSDSC